MFYGHEKTPRNTKVSGAFRMVGVARIELATPTMSTQCLGAKAAENGRFMPWREQNLSRTKPVFALGSRKTRARAAGSPIDRKKPGLLARFRQERGEVA